jgi:hypothetical protein
MAGAGLGRVMALIAGWEDDALRQTLQTAIIILAILLEEVG